MSSYLEMSPKKQFYKMKSCMTREFFKSLEINICKQTCNQYEKKNNERWRRTLLKKTKN